MNIDFEKVIQAIEKAVPEIKSLMFSTQLADELGKIAESNKILEEQYPLIVDEVGYVILGLKQKNTLAESLIEAGIDKNNADNVSKEIDSKIFSKIVPGSSIPKVEIVQKSEPKIRDIANKYSLNPEQTKILADFVVESSAGKQAITVDGLVSKLKISKLLAEQLLEDLKTRIFDVSKKTNPSVQDKPQAARVPEIKPDNLPAIEIGEVAKPYTPPKQEQKPQQNTPAAVPQPATPDFTKPAEPVQKPYAVPRFGMNQVEPKVQVINMNQVKPANPQSMMGDKMSNVTVNMGDNFMKKEPAEAPKMPTTKYAVDPYREPLA